MKRWKNSSRLSMVVVNKTMPRGMLTAPPIVNLLLQDQDRFLCAFSFQMILICSSAQTKATNETTMSFLNIPSMRLLLKMPFVLVER